MSKTGVNEVGIPVEINNETRTLAKIRLPSIPRKGEYVTVTDSDGRVTCIGEVISVVWRISESGRAEAVLTLASAYDTDDYGKEGA